MEDSMQNSSQINILLLGESGVGKSTFINAFGNYLYFDSFKSAAKEDLWWVPSIFTIPDENYEERVIHIGYNEDNFNENLIGVSNTKEPQEYIFNKNEIRICLIDTPGIGDSRGIKYDEENILNILQYVKQYSHLNAICFLLKPNVSILSEYFKCCITLLSSFLDVHAAENVIFVFTNCRSTFYKPGETRTVLMKLLEEIARYPPHVKVPLVKTNTFCMDNEWFRYKVAMRKGFEFSEKEMANFEESWKISCETCKQLLNYVLGNLYEKALKPAFTTQSLLKNLKPVEMSGYKESFNDYKLFNEKEIPSTYNLSAEPVDKTFDINSIAEAISHKTFEINDYINTEINLQREMKNSNIHLNLSSEELTRNRRISNDTNYNRSPYSTKKFHDVINYEGINKTASNLNHTPSKNLQHRNSQNRQIGDNTNILDSDSSLEDFPKRKNRNKKKKCKCNLL